jgi:hypothetical protein
MGQDTRRFQPIICSRSVFSSLFRASALLVVSLQLTACQPPDSPLKAENEQLRKQLAKQESVMSSIQEGTKVMQQQIDLLNRELREAKKQAEQAEAARKDLTGKLEREQQALGGKLQEERKALTGKLEADRRTFTTKYETERKALMARLEAETANNQRLAAENKRLNELYVRALPTIRIEEKGGQAADLPVALTTVCKGIEDVLTRNGYVIKVILKTDQRAVYVTERKVSSPNSMEVPGFRNEYFLSAQTVPNKGTRLFVKAAFEKVAHGGTIMTAASDEIADIERRLLGEISKTSGRQG